MTTESQAIIATHDPWNDLIGQAAIVAVPLDQVLTSLHIPRPEANAVKDELFEQLNRIIAQARVVSDQ